MNSSWLFKSKGTRKAIEFILNFIGTPDGLIEFNAEAIRPETMVWWDIDEEE